MPRKKKLETKDTNPDPITGESGAHPLGVGVGTAAGGAAAGALGGAVAGPVGVVVGAVAGGVAGAFAGKGVAEAIDPTQEDAYWSKHYRSRPYVEKGVSYDSYQPAYLYGVEAQEKYRGRDFNEIEPDLRKGWTKARGRSGLSWDKAREPIRDAYDRTLKLHEEELHAHKNQVKTGEARVRKEVVSEEQTIDVPVKHEELVIERRPVSRKASGAAFRAEEVHVPLHAEQASARKQTVLKEEVTVGKRKIQETKKVSGTVRKERLHVEEEGKAKVRKESKEQASR